MNKLLLNDGQKMVHRSTMSAFGDISALGAERNAPPMRNMVY